jgi:hypothetical protein
MLSIGYLVIGTNVGDKKLVRIKTVVPAVQAARRLVISMERSLRVDRFLQKLKTVAARIPQWFVDTVQVGQDAAKQSRWLSR